MAQLDTTVTPVIIVSSDREFLDTCFKSLKSYFHCICFEKNTPQLMEALLQPLRIVIVDESVSRSTVLNILNQSKKAGGNGFPILQIAPAAKVGASQTAENTKNVHILEKPYTQKILIGTLFDIMSGDVQKKWENYEEVNKKALTGCLSLFNDLPDKLISDEGLDLVTIKESTNPIIESIELGMDKELLAGLEGFDNYTFSHCLRSSVILSMFGKGFGLKGDDLKVLAAGGIVHDVGKLEIPFEILNKAGKLEGEEWEIMKSHVTKTGHFLRTKTDVPESILTIAEQHHEKIDGTGYPNGLKGRQLNDLARMATIVDVFGALTDERPYKDAFPVEKSFFIMESMKGHLDQKFVSVFKEIFMDNIYSGG